MKIFNHISAYVKDVENLRKINRVFVLVVVGVIVFQITDRAMAILIQEPLFLPYM